MIKTISKEKTYVPKFDKNRDLPANEQITVTYKAATIELKNKIVSRPNAIGEFDEAGHSKGVKIELKVDDEAYLRNMIISISGAGYKEDESGEVKYIRNASDLLKAPICFEPLITELVGVFREELTAEAVNEKN